jgi:carbamoyl-phosphate synthase large subunit
MKTNILLSSAGDKVPLVNSFLSTIAKSNLDLNLILGDIRKDALSFYFAKNNWVMPETNPDNLKAIIQGCLDRNIKIILPTRDGELEFYSENLREFQQKGISLIISENSTIKICRDKLKFHDVVKGSKLPIIPSSLVYESQFGDFVTVKERFGSGSRKVLSGLNREEAQDYAKKLEHPIFQPTIRGTEFSIDIWASKDGLKIISSPRLRIMIRDGESVITKVIKSEKISEVSNSLVRLLKIKGVAVIQGFINEYGHILINECNPRVGGASTATINAGGPLIELAILDFLEMSIDSLFESIKIKEITQVRASFDTCI